MLLEARQYLRMTWKGIGRSTYELFFLYSSQSNVAKSAIAYTVYRSLIVCNLLDLSLLSRTFYTHLCYYNIIIM